jgi:hypothetical protein
MNGWNPTEPPLISCTARATPSRPTWKPGWAELASLGYSTSLCHSVLQATPLFDRRGWFQALQNRLKSTPYPDRLVEGVIKLNLSVLGKIIHSYEQQVRSAFRRRDRVSLNHRIAAWLASYFDILFAANRRFNPGEKRLLAHAQALPTTPERMVADVEAACTGACSLERCVADHLEAMRAGLEHYLQAQGLLSPQVTSCPSE